ncbi:hypothetical protein FB45DRAFT_840634 [Roridomyces roridus]|uniref:F-box domain-containing protein n=1 Tax=Roridomyces roridus TaxID=1738132 RepID=A0AAD7BD25_9AGAR|nr:hypothetical protein FB45DRAFT_840634 [Roridomyces roridus]
MQSSPFDPLLESNEPPDEREIGLIRRFLGEKRERLHEVKSLPYPTPEINELECCIEAHTALLSPIRRIPGELLSEIFIHLSYKRKVGRRNIDAPPWLLGHVCRGWRNAALSTSILWRLVKIYEPQSPALHKICPISMIETQLARSGNATLEICFNLQFRRSTHHHQALLHALLQHSHRWRVFRVHLRGSAELVPAFSGMHNRIPLLCEFLLTQSNMRPGEIHSYLSEAPALRKLTLTDSTLDKESPYIPSVPWHQITHYRATCTTQQHFDVLLAAPNLVECSLGFLWRDWGGDYRAGKHAVLSHLRRLTWGDSPEPDFLTHVTAGPALNDLTVRAPYTAVPSFLHRSSSGQFLTRLFLDDDYTVTTAEEIVDILKEASALKTLGVSCGAPRHEMGQVWTAMTIADEHSGPNILCPQLRSLVYISRNSEQHGEIEASFFPMVHSRCREPLAGEASFESLRVLAIGSMREFVESIAQGMRLLPDALDAALLEDEDAAAFLKDSTM